jgi:hypothetical protein
VAHSATAANYSISDFMSMEKTPEGTPTPLYRFFFFYWRHLVHFLWKLFAFSQLKP